MGSFRCCADARSGLRGLRYIRKVSRDILKNQLFINIRKLLLVASRPDERWRLTLLAHRHLLPKRRVFSGQGVIEDRVLNAHIHTARRHPAALQLTVRKLWRAGELSSGLELVDEVWARRGASSYDAALACANTWFQYGRRAEGDAALAAAKRHRPGDFRSEEVEARELHRRGNVAGALASAKRALALARGPVAQRNLRVFLSEQAFRLGDYRSVVDYLAPVDSVDLPWERHYELAASYASLGDPTQAAAEFRCCAMKAVPEARKGYELPELHFRADRPQAVLESLASSPKGPDWLRLMARSQLALGRFEECAALCLGADRTVRSAQYGALALELLGRHAEAVAVYADLAKSPMSVKQKHTILERYARAARNAGDHVVSVSVRAMLHANEGARLKDLDEEVNPQFGRMVKAAEEAIGRADWGSALRWLHRMELSASSWRNYELINRALGMIGGDLVGVERASDAFAKVATFPLPNIGELHSKPVPLQKVERFYETQETLGVEEGVVLYEAFYGAKTTCNPLAICLELLQREQYSHLQHVWVIRDDTPIHPELLGRDNVHFVRYQSSGYVQRLATAEIVLTNSTFPSWYLRREGQRYVNTWHGVPWKRLGRDVTGDSFSYHNVARNMLQVSDLLMPNAYTAERLTGSQDVAGIAPYAAHIIGSPRVDRTLGQTADQREQLLERLGLSGGRPIVFFAPTWRGTMGDRQDSTNDVFEAVRVLAKGDVDVMLRSHYFAEDTSASRVLPANVVVPDESFDSNELLALTDVLVSDYSSIIFDFAPLNRPIIKHVYDLEEYVEERGLYFEVGDIPGSLSRSPEELEAAFAAALTDADMQKNQEESATGHLWEMEDGNASQRAINVIFNPPAPVHAMRNRLLLSMNSLNPNGISRSFTNLLAAIAPRIGRVQTLLPASYFGSPDSVTRGNALRGFTDFSLRTHPIAGTRQERVVWRRLAAATEPFPAALQHWLQSRMRTEFRRLFGQARFEAVVDFDGHDIYAAALVAYGPDADTKRIYVGHSEFIAEMEMRFPNHRGIGELLQGFSKVASVSEAVRQANAEGLAKRFSVHPSSNVVLQNTLIVEEIRSQAMEPLDADLSEWLERPGSHLIMLGRLSPEKNHLLALRSLLAARMSGEDVDLLILGEGMTRDELRGEVSELGLTDYVFFAGQRANPYSALRRADGLLLTSTHEGQPMVFLEAMTVGTPVASVRIPAAESVLDDGRHGMLVDPTEKGVAEAISALSHGQVPPAKFDSDAYLDDVVRSFMRLISADA